MKTNIFLLVAFILALAGCKNDRSQINLPNDYSFWGKKYSSKSHPGSTNISTHEENLVEKSRIAGTISYIGFLKIEE